MTAGPAAAPNTPNGSDELGSALLALPLAPAPPWEWALDELGRPTWIAPVPGGRWQQVFDWDLGFDVVLRLEMPVVGGRAGETVREQLGPDPYAERARRAAWLRDGLRCSHDYIARQVGQLGGDPKLAKRRVRDGRSLLHEQGVLPWAAFEPGRRLPKRWWTQEEFLTGLAQWSVRPADAALSLSRLARHAAAVASGMPLIVREAQARLRQVAGG